MAHEYSVEFRIHGKDLDPAKITARLGLEPSRTRLAGDRRGSGVWDKGMWAFNGGSDDYWDSLDEGLVSVLEELWPHRHVIAEYAETIWWCGHFSSSFDGGPVLLPTTMKKLGEFGVKLFIDTYCPSEIVLAN